MFRYGEKVVIRDGSRLDGAEGIVLRVNSGEIQVLLDREVIWMVTEQHLEHSRPGGRAPAAGIGDSGH
ncbi:MAG: hypothetical protein FDZ69_02475 [Deltaproteobacteria bacterium]|nr:MAG: hypothetical protein FDZ69_02475 [Deltaproteobacteria bacterium]